MEQQQLGPYRLLNRLGRGGMGAVYEALDEQTGETVAVKILATHLADDPGLRQRFEAEIETLKPLRSNGIVNLLAYGEQDGQPYFAMELVRGKSLDREKFRQMIDEYYELHGWDENGVPRPETLEKLGLDGEPSHLLWRNDL